MNPKQPLGPPMTLGNMRNLGVPLFLYRLSSRTPCCLRDRRCAGLFLSNSYDRSTVNMKHPWAFGSCTGSLLISDYQPIVVLRVLLIGFSSN